jgi:hypothetical protein
MVKKVRKGTRKKTGEATKGKRPRQLTPQEQNILREAMCYCLHHFPMLWTTGGLPQECVADDGCRRWIIAVYLRYPTGHEGYLGDLRYDGKQFTEVTDRKVMEGRAKQIEADPARQREWDEYRASTVARGTRKP